MLRWQTMLLAVGVAAGVGGSAAAVPIQIKVENLAPTDGVYFSPLWTAFHNGTFDLFDPGAPASDALEALAENGDFSGLDTLLGAAGQSQVAFGNAGINTPPAFDPGESTTIAFDVADPMTNRWLAFASMVVPSNDAFIGTPDSIEIFDAAGQFHGKMIITILGSQVWDSGTEVNNEMGAAFINQAPGNLGTDDDDVVGLHPGYIGSFGGPDGTPIILGGSNGLGAYFDPAGVDFTLPNAVIARITITPEPASLALLGLGGLALIGRGRRGGVR